MAKSTDDRGRLYLPKEVRERYGEQYRVVELPDHVALFPVDEDPFEGLRAALGDDTGESRVVDRDTDGDQVADEGTGEAPGGNTRERDGRN